MATNGHGATQIVKPQVKSTVVPVPLSNERLALHRGPFKAEHQLMIVADPGGLIKAAMDKMNGSRTLPEIAGLLNADGFSVGAPDLSGITEMLADRGVIADAETLSTASMSQAAAARYSRNLNCFAATTPDDRTAAEIQAAIGRAHVLILGVGGIGTAVAVSLAMAGCGQLTLVDFDLVELSNLNRQLLFTVDDLGRPKANVAREALERINPDVKISTIITRLESEEQVHQLIKSTNPDFVADAADRPAVAIDRWINKACFAEGVPYSANSVSGNMALFWTKIPGQTGCYNCDELWTERGNPDQFELKKYREKHDLIAGTSALSFAAMTIGALTASEIIRVITKWPAASAGRTILIDFPALKLTEYDRPAHPDCPVCAAALEEQSCASTSRMAVPDDPSLDHLAAKASAQAPFRPVNFR
jgi:molybdopterin-synthase adenylyltransferase